MRPGKSTGTPINWLLPNRWPTGSTPSPSLPPSGRKTGQGSGGDIIRTTINKGIQDQVTAILKDYIEENRKRGIRNAALLLTDTGTGEVKAYVASQDFFDDDNLGKIDGIQMRRSSASTLKPFLYALAMDEGMIIRESRLLDIPISYGGYTPIMPIISFPGWSGQMRP